jgi:hypothetical protein
MATSEQEIVRKTINWCKSVKKNISKFSYELEEDYEDDDNYDCEDEYPLESDFVNIIAKQRERLDDTYVDLNDFLEDYDGDHEYEIHQAQMSIDYASVQLQDIESNYDSLVSISDFNNQIVSAAESLDEAIEYLEGCNDDMF